LGLVRCVGLSAGRIRFVDGALHTMPIDVDLRRPLGWWTCLNATNKACGKAPFDRGIADFGTNWLAADCPTPVADRKGAHHDQGHHQNLYG
jgi:hypothetical protein